MQIFCQRWNYWEKKLTYFFIFERKKIMVYRNTKVGVNEREKMAEKNLRNFAKGYSPTFNIRRCLISDAVNRMTLRRICPLLESNPPASARINATFDANVTWKLVNASTPIFKILTNPPMYILTPHLNA